MKIGVRIFSVMLMTASISVTSMLPALMTYNKLRKFNSKR